MRLAKVVGQVVSTVKEPGLDGFKILLVENVDPGDPEREPFDGEAYPAIDVVGAGVLPPELRGGFSVDEFGVELIERLGIAEYRDDD